MAIATHDAPRTYEQLSQTAPPQRVLYPPDFLEYAWYVSLIYAFLGQAWGVEIPWVGNALRVFIAVGCVLSIWAKAGAVYKPITLALCTGVLAIAIQLIFHKQSSDAWHEGIDLVVWMATLVTAQALSLRPQFLKRFALVALGIGLASLPFIEVRTVGKVMRAWASGTGIGNPNTLGMWFGFCVVYLVCWGLQAQSFKSRIIAWSVGVGCFYVVAISVSRAPLVACILACLVGLRSVLKRAFIPAFSLGLLICVVIISGVFDEEIGYYTSRGTEETGREVIWQVALDRFYDAPWIGNGLGDIRVRRGAGRFINPHNGLLHIAVGVGVFPLICFVGYLMKAVIGAFYRMGRIDEGEAILLPPLVVFALIEIMVLDYTFMFPWAVVVLGLAAKVGEAAVSQKG